MANLIIQPLSVPEMYVVAVMLERSDADLDDLSIAQEALACCAQLISVSAVYRTLDRLERRGVVTWESASEGPARAVRSNRRYKVTRDGHKAFERSLGFLSVEDRGKIARKATRFQVERRNPFGLNDDEDD